MNNLKITVTLTAEQWGVVRQCLSMTTKVSDDSIQTARITTPIYDEITSALESAQNKSELI